MGILLSVYNDMVKEAEMSVVAEQVEVLEKYASAATELLQAEFPNDYTKEDVVELADKLIQRDVELNAQNEKVAEAKAITEEYVKVAEQLLEQEHGKDFSKEAVAMLADKMMEADAQVEFDKEAQAIKMQGFLDEFNKMAETNFQTMEEFNEALAPFFDKEAGMKDKVVKTMSELFAQGKQKGVKFIENYKDNFRTMKGGPTGFYGANPTTKERVVAGAKVVGAPLGAVGVAGAGALAMRGEKSEK